MCCQKRVRDCSQISDAFLEGKARPAVRDIEAGSESVAHVRSAHTDSAPRGAHTQQQRTQAAHRHACRRGVGRRPPGPRVLGLCFRAGGSRRPCLVLRPAGGPLRFAPCSGTKPPTHVAACAAAPAQARAGCRAARDTWRAACDSFSLRLLHTREGRQR